MLYLIAAASEFLHLTRHASKAAAWCVPWRDPPVGEFSRGPREYPDDDESLAGSREVDQAVATRHSELKNSGKIMPRLLPLCCALAFLLSTCTSINAAEAIKQSWNIDGIKREAFIYLPINDNGHETHPLVF